MRVHLTLQGKGGVGKSFVSALLAQYLIDKGEPPTCIDTDPVNCTFSEYKAFGAKRIELMNGSRINERNFDQLMELIFNQEEGDFVVDSGASTFVPLSNYLVENRAVEMLVEAGKEVIVHPVVTGGQALFDTLNGLDSLATQFSKSAGIIVWLNEYFGDIIHDNKPFESMKIYQKHRERLNGLIRIPRQNPDTFGRDVEEMLNSKLTFAEAIGNGQFTMMAKQRLRMVQKAIYGQLDLVL
jgi:hypothetical protein